MKEITLSNGQQTQVSDEDWLYLVGFSWSLNGDGYVRRSGDDYMHRVVAQRKGLTCLDDIDHEDRDRLNNQRENLRDATRSQNVANSAKHSDSKLPKGVRRHGLKFQAVICCDGQTLCLGTFGTPGEASDAYFDNAQKLFNEFARQ